MSSSALSTCVDQITDGLCRENEGNNSAPTRSSSSVMASSCVRTLPREVWTSLTGSYNLLPLTTRVSIFTVLVEQLARAGRKGLAFPPRKRAWIFEVLAGGQGPTEVNITFDPQRAVRGMLFRPAENGGSHG